MFGAGQRGGDHVLEILCEAKNLYRSQRTRQLPLITSTALKKTNPAKHISKTAEFVLQVS